ncbi:MAG: DUF1573 domain-containing protein [Candidatus Dadabacteria bacterium]|nr:MAG: DUF1573 domain-containing protein [Candidatus Dadabacteria bacterium]
MPRKAFCLSLVFFALILPLKVIAEQKESKESLPKAYVPLPLFDFGTVEEGKVVKHDFVISNKGESDLIIYRVVPSCGCTTTFSTNKTIAPKKSEKIKVAYKTLGFSGSQKKIIRVFTNDPSKKEINLILTGKVIPEVSVSPEAVIFPEVIKAEGLSKYKKKIVIKTSSKAKITGVFNYSRYLNLTDLTKSLKKDAKKERVLEVSFKEDVPLGELRDRIIVRLAGGVRRSVNIPVVASVRGAIRITPTRLSFGVLVGKDIKTKTVKIENLSPSPLHILKIESSSKAVTTNYQEVKKGKLYKIKVTVNPSKVKTLLRATVKIFTDGDEKEIPILVYGIVPSGLTG